MITFILLALGTILGLALVFGLTLLVRWLIDRHEKRQPKTLLGVASPPEYMEND